MQILDNFLAKWTTFGQTQKRVWPIFVYTHFLKMALFGRFLGFFGRFAQIFLWISRNWPNGQLFFLLPCDKKIKIYSNWQKFLAICPFFVYAEILWHFDSRNSFRFGFVRVILKSPHNLIFFVLFKGMPLW